MHKFIGRYVSDYCNNRKLHLGMFPTTDDAGVYLVSCDKGMLANLMGLARVDISAVVVPGGTMNAALRLPEMFYTSEAISSYAELGKSIALITDGRFSGASTGPVIRHCSPEAVDGGPIALVEEDDLIEIDVFARKLNIIGVKGEKKTMEEMDAILAERKKNWQPAQ